MQAEAYISLVKRRKTMNIRQKLKEYAAARKAMRELQALDDHTLADLGISRSQIRAAVLGQ